MPAGEKPSGSPIRRQQEGVKLTQQDRRNSRASTDTGETILTGSVERQHAHAMGASSPSDETRQKMDIWRSAWNLTGPVFKSNCPGEDFVEISYRCNHESCVTGVTLPRSLMP